MVVYYRLIKYKNKDAKEWKPNFIEIILTVYSYSPETPIKCPKEWPDLKDSLTIKRSESLYSLYLLKEKFRKLISELKEKQAVEINGKKFSVSYRFTFPNKINTA